MPHDPGLHTQPILRFRDGKAQPVNDLLAVEEPLDIRLSTGGTARSVAITMRTPGRDEDLARGFLFTEGIIGASSYSSEGALAQVRGTVEDSSEANVVKNNVVRIVLPPGTSVDWKKLERHSYTSSSCGVCGKTSLEQVFTTVPFGDTPTRVTVAPEVLQSLPGKLRSAQELFDQTGGIHAAGLFTPAGELLHFAEDVGRHNALDKLIGHHHAKNLLPLDEHVLLLSGRASFELIQKAGMAGIGVVAAVGAPSSLAAQLAEELGITLVGFLRAGGFNCYTNVDRIH